MNSQIDIKDQTTINELYYLLTKANFAHKDLNSAIEKISSIKTNLNLISNNNLSLMQAAIMSRSIDVISALIQKNYIVKNTEVDFSKKYPHYKHIHDYLVITVINQSGTQIQPNRKSRKPPLL